MARKQWTRNDDKNFENALVQFPDSYPYRFETIAYHLHMPLEDVMHYYDALVYDISLIESGEYATINYPDNSGGISSHTRHMDKDRKKGIPWTAAEHRSFLVGLAKFGRGDWKSIARDYVRSRTPMQVASHAQKYFLRQIGESKAKKRSSIHDTTSVDHVADNVTDPPTIRL